MRFCVFGVCVLLCVDVLRSVVVVRVVFAVVLLCVRVVFRCVWYVSAVVCVFPRRSSLMCH